MTFPPYAPPTSPHLGLPLPSPDAPSQRADVERIAAALGKLDEAVGRARLHQLLNLDIA